MFTLDINIMCVLQSEYIAGMVYILEYLAGLARSAFVLKHTTSVMLLLLAYQYCCPILMYILQSYMYVYQQFTAVQVDWKSIHLGI